MEDVLRQLVEEVVESANRMVALTAKDPDLAELWVRYYQVRGHIRTLYYPPRHILTQASGISRVRSEGKTLPP